MNNRNTRSQNTFLPNPKPVTAACLLALAGLFTAARPAAAQTTVIGFTPNALAVEANAAAAGASSYSLGFEFTANSPVFVTALGFFNDPSFDPNVAFNSVSPAQTLTGSYSYADSHQVGLYQVVPGVGAVPESGIEVASATVTSSSTPSGNFLYTTLTAPVALITGDQYVLAGVTGATDPYIYDVLDGSSTGTATGLTTPAAITYNQDRYAVSDTLAYADMTDTGTATDSGPGFLGPNFQISTTLPSAAPEPSEWGALGLSALGLGELLLRVRRRSAATTN